MVFKYMENINSDAKKHERKLSLVIATVVFCLFLTNLSFMIQNAINIEQSLVSNICKGVIFVTILLCWKIYFVRLNIFLIKFLFSTCFLIIFSILFFGTNEYFTETLQYFLTNVLPMVITFSVIRDYKELLIILRKVAFVTSCILSFCIISGSFSTFNSYYSMGFANSLVLPCIILIEQLLNESNKFKFILLMSGLLAFNVFAVLVYGSRGAFIEIIAFFIYAIGFMLIRKKSVASVVIFLAIVFMFAFNTFFLNAGLEFLSIMGFDSRTIHLLINDWTQDSNRFLIWSRLLEKIIDEPFTIRGISADFLLNGTYSHNYFLELVYEFGVLGGGLLSLVIIWNIITTLKNGIKDYKSRIEILLLFSFFPICLWSGSIWGSMYFWSWFTIYYVGEHNEVLLAISRSNVKVLR